MRSLPARGAGAWLLLAPTLSLAAARPPNATLSLRWSDPDRLAATTAEEFEGRLSERLGHPAFDPAIRQRTLSVTWQGSPDQCGVQLLLVKADEVEGTREIESPNGDCAALVPAMLTVAALLLEAEPAEPAPTATPSATRAAPRPAPAVPTVPAPPATKTAPDERAGLLLSLGGALTSGSAPKLELGPAAAVIWAPLPLLRFGAEGAFFIERQYGNGPAFALNHQRVGLLGCAMPLHARVALGLCANAALQFFTSEGLALPQPRIRDATTLSVGGGLRAEWRLGAHWRGVTSLAADVATRRLYFYYTPRAGGETTLFRQPRVMPTLLLGLAFELP